MVILDKGSIVAEGTPYELKNRYVQDTIAPLSGVDLQNWPSRHGMNAPITMQHEQANIQTIKYIINYLV